MVSSVTFLCFFWHPNHLNMQMFKYVDGCSRLICLLNKSNLEQRKLSKIDILLINMVSTLLRQQWQWCGDSNGNNDGRENVPRV
jgi:hypothetical protein